MRRRVARVRVRRLDARDASVERVGRLAQRELELGARGGRLGGEPRVAEVRRGEAASDRRRTSSSTFAPRSTSASAPL
jgi:hypothetical protein